MFHASTTLMWGDEGFSVYSASRDLYAITFEGKDVDPHPPLYYYLFHFWLPLAGTSKLAIRFFSIFFGTATVAIVSALGRRLFSSRVGMLSAALLAIAPFAVQYSQEVRMYALVMFLGALTTYVFVQLIPLSPRAPSQNECPTPITNARTLPRGATLSPKERRSLSPLPSRERVRVRVWVTFFLSMLLTQYSLYQSAFLLVAQGIFLLPFFKTKFKFILRWLALALAVVLLFLPWFYTHSSSAIADVQGVAGNTKPFSLFEFLARGFSAISVGPTLALTTQFTLAAIILAILLLGLGLAVFTRAATRHDWLLIAHVAAPMLALYPIYYIAPLYRGRLFALALVPLAILLARSATLITARAKLAGLALALFFLGASTLSLSNYFFRYSRYNASVDDYIPAIRAIQARATAGDVVLFHAYWQIGYFLAEYHGAPVEYRLLDNSRDVEYALAKPRNVWAIVQGLPFHGAEATLARAAYPYDEAAYGQMRVAAFRAGDPGRAEKFSPPIQYDNGVALLGYRINDAPIQAGRGVATLELEWQTARAERIGSDYTMSLRLMNAQGQVIAQIDTQPVAGLAPTSSWNPGEKILDRRGLPIPADAPIGEYFVQMIVYQYTDNRVSRIIAPEELRGAALTLGSVVVIK